MAKILMKESYIDLRTKRHRFRSELIAIVISKTNI